MLALLQMEYLAQKLAAVGIGVDEEALRSAKDEPTGETPTLLRTPHVRLWPPSVSFEVATQKSNLNLSVCRQESPI